jgi:hypothetical protein
MHASLKHSFVMVDVALMGEVASRAVPSTLVACKLLVCCLERRFVRDGEFEGVRSTQGEVPSCIDDAALEAHR